MLSCMSDVLNTLSNEDQERLRVLHRGARHSGRARDELAAFAAERGWSDDTLNLVLTALTMS